MKKLPVKIDAYIMTECWTYYRLAIIQAYEQGRRWLASHMELFMRDMAANFGANDEIYMPDYFGNILTYEEINIWQTPLDKIIEAIVTTIDQGNYIIMDLSMHETLFYGYDEKEKLLYTTWLNENGIFVETAMTYDFVISCYKRCLEMVHENPMANITRRSYQFIVSKVRIRTSDYVPDNDVYSCFEKIKREANGAKSTVQQYDQNGVLTTERDFYHGLSCLIGIASGLNVTPDEFLVFNEENPGRIHKSLRALYEHRMIILDSLDWIIDELEINNEDILRERDIYLQCTEKMHRLYLKYIKLEMTGHTEDIIDSKEELKKQYVCEKAALLSFRERAMAVFCERERK